MHADAPTIDETDWPQIVALYDHLLAIAPSPVVALNRAIAIGEVQDPSAALALVDELDLDNFGCGSTFEWHASGAHLLERGTAELPEAPDNVSIIGCDAANGTYSSCTPTSAASAASTR